MAKQRRIRGLGQAGIIIPLGTAKEVGRRESVPWSHYWVMSQRKKGRGGPKT